MKLKSNWITDLPLIQEIKDDYKFWKGGDYVLIMAGTGTGKNTFVIHILEDIARKSNKKILLLSNRKDLKNQNKSNIIKQNATDIITTVNYQYIEECISSTDKSYKHQLELYSEYDYIICDETHYFLTDSWNKTTDLSYKWILDQQAVKIFMSATGVSFFELLLEDINIQPEQLKGYKVDIDYSYIEKITYYKHQDYIEQLIKNLPPNEKVIYFCRKAKNDISNWLKDETFLNKKLGENLGFVCGSEHTYKKLATTDALNEDDTLKYQVTIVTKVWDNGINIRDKQLRHIIIDFDMPDEFIQCLGRRRKINDDDKIILHVKNWSKANLNRHKFYINTEIKKTEDYLNNPKEMLKKYKTDRAKITSCMFNDLDTGVLTVNKLIYRNYKIMIENYDEAMDIGFDKYIYKLLNCDSIQIEYNEDKEMKEKTSKFEVYLDNLVGKKLFKEQQQELCDMIINEMYSIKSKYRIRGKILKPFTLEIIIRDELGLKYAISKPVTENLGENRNKKYIIISKIVDLPD